MSVNFFLGFRMGVHPEWRDRVGPLTPPGNYKKQETIQKWIDEKWQEIEDNTAVDALAGTVERVAVMGLNGKDPELLKPEEFVEKVNGSKFKPVRLFAFDIQDRMIQLMMTIFDRGGTQFPHWMLHNSPSQDPSAVLIDPYKEYIQGYLPRVKFLQYAPINGVAKTAYRPGDTDAIAVEGAKLARAVAELLAYV